WLADRLRGNDPDRVADLAHPARGKEDAVASLADAELAPALQHRTNRKGCAFRVVQSVEHLAEQRHRDERALLGEHRLAGLARGERLVDVLSDRPPEQA